MHTFEWIEAALGVIVTLGITRLVVSVANLFIARRQVQMDWMPFAWAGVIFALLLQFSWNFVPIGAHMKTWSFGMFILLLVFSFNLFIASALILLNSESQSGGNLMEWYSHNGRWAMPFIAFYLLITGIFCHYFQDINPLHDPASVIIIITAIVSFFSCSRTVLASATVLAFLSASGLMIEMAIYQ